MGDSGSSGNNTDLKIRALANLRACSHRAVQQTAVLGSALSSAWRNRGHKENCQPSLYVIHLCHSSENTASPLAFFSTASLSATAVVQQLHIFHPCCKQGQHRSDLTSPSSRLLKVEQKVGGSLPYEERKL